MYYGTTRNLLFVCIDNIKKLTGQVASVDDIKQLTYMAYRFSTKIVSIETVRYILCFEKFINAKF